ncbi:MAG: hypothetical protein DRI69_03305 [Bacteroidetes bacterium]|nr:MAG: hypothetical protein DRI69_03305 [Bacteroidota bacterium]
MGAYRTTTLNMVLSIGYIFLLAMVCPDLTAQDRHITDSLTLILNSAQEDTNKVHVLRELFWEYKRSDPEKAKDYIDQSLQLANDLKFELGIAKAKYSLSGYYHVKADFTREQMLLLEAKQTFEKLGDSMMSYACLLDIGNLYQAQRKYAEAAEYILQAVSGFEKLGNDRSLARAYNTLGILYYGQEKYTDALDAYSNALQMCINVDLKQGIAVCSGNIATVLFKLKRYDEALTHFESTLLYQQDLNDRVGIVKTYNNIGMLHHELGAYEKALNFHTKALALYSELDYSEGIAIAHLNIGLDLTHLDNPTMAIDHYHQSIEFAREYGFRETLVKAYGNLSDVYASILQFENAYTYATLYKEQSDSLQKDLNAEKVLELQTRYQTEEKVKQIALLNRDNELNELKLRRNRNFNYIGMAFTALGILLAYFLFRNYRHRRSVSEMRARRESDRKLIAMEQRLLTTVIITEEKERKRFAADLHDEMGPLLSSIMLYLQDIPEVSGQEQSEMIEYTQELVDQAIREIRDISNNIMPGAISEKGLNRALKTFCEKIERTKAILVNFNDNTTGVQLKAGVEVVLYRVLIELINNTLKHAQAHHIEITFTEKEDTIVIRYMDDGIGFDPEEISKIDGHGMGLINIRDRIASLNGKLDMKSKSGEGTEIHIIVGIS